MSNNTLTFEGLDELKEALRNLPADLTQEAGDIITQTTNVAADKIVAAYPDISGHLRGGVRFTVERSSEFGVVGTVKNTAKLAWIWELGTQARHIYGGLPWPVSNFGIQRGSTPPHHTFVPIVMQERRKMYEQLKDVVAKAGLEVSGDA